MRSGRGIWAMVTFGSLRVLTGSAGQGQHSRRQQHSEVRGHPAVAPLWQRGALLSPSGTQAAVESLRLKVVGGRSVSPPRDTA